jgi:hypothetical protein
MRIYKQTGSRYWINSGVACFSDRAWQPTIGSPKKFYMFGRYLGPQRNAAPAMFE